MPLVAPTLRETQIDFSSEVIYVDIFLNQKLTWIIFKTSRRSLYERWVHDAVFLRELFD